MVKALLLPAAFVQTAMISRQARARMTLAPTIEQLDLRQCWRRQGSPGKVEISQ